MSSSKIMCHIVFGTKARDNSINPEFKEELFNYIAGIVSNKKCFLKKINGMPDHLHMLIDLHPTISLSELMEAVKASSSKWLKGNPHFRKFKGWGKGYFAASVSASDDAGCIRYIESQEDHHKNHGLLWEIEYMIKMIELEWYPDDWS